MDSLRDAKSAYSFQSEVKFGLDVSDLEGYSRIYGLGRLTKGRSQTGEVRGEGEDEEHHCTGHVGGNGVEVCLDGLG